MFSLAHSIFLATAASLLIAQPTPALDSPLSDTAIRSAYFLGQRYKASPGEYLGPYTKFLPTPKTGPHVQVVQFLTPFAQLVREYATRVGEYSAQQAQIDHRSKEENVIITIAIALTPTYSRFLSPGEMAAAGLSKDQNLRPSTFWKDFRYQAFDDNAGREPTNLSGRGNFNCGKWGGNCVLTGATVTMEFPASAFSSQLATIEITSPDGQVVHADFDLASFR
jgi:hypothetical protein